MYRLRSYRSIKTGARRIVRTSVLSLAIALTACANDPGYRQEAAGVAGPAPRIASVPVPELEDDGLPGQVAPQPRASREPDDPSEPFSPNYGTGVSNRRASIEPPQHVASVMPAR